MRFAHSKFFAIHIEDQFERVMRELAPSVKQLRRCVVLLLDQYRMFVGGADCLWAVVNKPVSCSPGLTPSVVGDLHSHQVRQTVSAANDDRQADAPARLLDT